MSQYQGHDSGGSSAGRGSGDDSDDEQSGGSSSPGPVPDTGTDEREDSDSGASLGLTVVLGVVLGLVAFALNYVVMFLFTSVDDVDFSSETAPDFTFRLVGQILYNAQFVPVKGTWASAGEEATRVVVNFNYITGTTTLVSGPESTTQTGSSSSELVTAVGSTIPTVAYHLAPVVVLFLSGFVLVAVMSGKPNAIAGAVVGTFITFGTFVAAVAGVFLFKISYGELFSLTLAPRLLLGIGLAGILFPLVAGALGGIAGSTFKRMLAG